MWVTGVLTYCPVTPRSQPALTRTAGAWFILPAPSPSWFVCLSHEELTLTSESAGATYKHPSPQIKRGKVVVPDVLFHSGH